jgi:uncharacterized membrane protein
MKNVKRFAGCIGEKPLCNQRPDRAPHIFGYCFPLCWRCTSLIMGYIAGSALQAGAYHIMFSILCCLPAFIDSVLQYKFNKESTNIRRIITGGLAGLGIGGLP